MFTTSTLLVDKRLGPCLIGAGLAIVLFAQFVPGIPIASAILLIGCGATGYLISWARTARCQSLVIVNAVVYLMLGSFALASQLHLVAQNGGISQHNGLLLRADLLLAVLLGAGMALVMLRTIFPREYPR